MDNYYEHFDHFSFPIFVTVWQFEPMLPTLGFLNAYNSKVLVLRISNIFCYSEHEDFTMELHFVSTGELYGVILVLCRILNCIAISLEAVNK